VPQYAAWLDEGAWQGMTRPGGSSLTAQLAGTIALNELIVHDWDRRPWLRDGCRVRVYKLGSVIRHLKTQDAAGQPHSAQ